jgi:hypothetical protein
MLMGVAYRSVARHLQTIAVEQPPLWSTMQGWWRPCREWCTSEPETTGVVELLEARMQLANRE